MLYVTWHMKCFAETKGFFLTEWI